MRKKVAKKISNEYVVLGHFDSMSFSYGDCTQESSSKKSLVEQFLQIEAEQQICGAGSKRDDRTTLYLFRGYEVLPTTDNRFSTVKTLLLVRVVEKSAGHHGNVQSILDNLLILNRVPIKPKMN